MKNVRRSVGGVELELTPLDRKSVAGTAWYTDKSGAQYCLKADPKPRGETKMSLFANMTLFDFETTGFSGENDRVIEFAAIRIRNGRLVNTLAHVINPEVELPEKITELTGITAQDLEGAPTMAQFLPWLMSFIGDGILVAHNAAFDLWFLNANNQRYRGKSVSNSFIDTLALCIDHFPYQKNQLEVVCERLGVPMTGAHRALNDVMGMWGVLQKLAELNGEEWIVERVNRLYYFNKYGKKEWYPTHAEVIGL